MKKVIRLTESDLTRIVKRVIKEGWNILPKPWEIIDVKKGDTMQVNPDTGTEVLYLNGNTSKGLSYNKFQIRQNPRQVQLDQAGAMNVVSFDPNTKMVTFNNGLVIGPA